MKKHILTSITLTSLAATLLTGCSALFTPTETHAYRGSDLVVSISSPQSSENTQSSGSSQGTSEQSSPSSFTAPSDITTPVSSEYSPRYLELKQQLSYDSNGRYCLSKEESDFADKTLFAGDSICRGFSAYNIIKARNVYAAGSTGARNFLDKNFYYCGREPSYKEVLSELKPEQVIFWMGMNDINMTSASEYCENYRKIIDLTLENSSANVYICSISPINSAFAENGHIDAFNLAMKMYVSDNFEKRVKFIDIANTMKNGANTLSQGLDSGDGIHLAPECYYVAMLDICKQLKAVS